MGRYWNSSVKRETHHAALIVPPAAMRSIPVGRRACSIAGMARTGIAWYPISRPTRTPSARIASGSPSSSAAGAMPRASSSSMIALDELEPRVAASARTVPAIETPCCGWRGSVRRAVAGSTPPQKLIGSARRRRGPCAVPSTRTRRVSSTMSRPQPLVPCDAAAQRGGDAIGEAAIDCGEAGVGRRVVGELAGIGHQHAARLWQDRGDDDAGVGDDLDASLAQPRERAVALDGAEHAPAGAGVEWDLEPRPGDEPVERGEFLGREMRAAD